MTQEQKNKELSTHIEMPDIEMYPDDKTSELSTHVSPTDRINASKELLIALKPMIQENYVVNIQGRTYIMVAGAQALASAMGYTVRIKKCQHNVSTSDMAGHWESRAVVIDTSNGREIGEGYGHVFDDENPWGKRPRFAQAAMCQTRATGRALKSCVGWMFALCGAEGSFLEEMPQEVISQPISQPISQSTITSKNITFEASVPQEEQPKPVRKFDDMPDSGTEIFTPVSAEVAKTGQSKYGNWELVIVKTVEGAQFATLDKRIAQAARELCAGGEQRCSITWARTPKGGLDMKKIEPAKTEGTTT